MPLPATSTPASYALRVEIQIPQNAFVRHVPWDQLQAFTRLDGPAIAPASDVVTIDALRRGAILNAGTGTEPAIAEAQLERAGVFARGNAPVAAKRAEFAAAADALRSRIETLLDRPYPVQVAEKEARVRDLLGERHAPSAWLPTLTGPESGFRNKAKMVVGGTIDEPTLGILDGRGQGVDLRGCGLHTSGIQEALPTLAAFVTRALSRMPTSATTPSTSTMATAPTLMVEPSPKIDGGRPNSSCR